MNAPRSLTFAAVFCLLFLYVPCSAMAATWYVPSAQCPTIVSAVTQAGNTDVIVLTGASYSGAGNVDVSFQGKAVTIRSQSGDPALCTINCGGSAGSPHRGFRFVSNEDTLSVLEGVTITGGYGPTQDVMRTPRSVGGAIYCNEGSPKILNCVIEANQAGDYGGGIYTRMSAPKIIGATFSGNVAGTYGGGIFELYSYALPEPLTLIECTFVGNSASNVGGAIDCDAASLTGCYFSGNSAGEGGAIDCGNLTLTDCTFSGNWTTMWAGGAIRFQGSGVATNCAFTGNVSAQVGGAVCCFPDDVTFINCTFSGNSANGGGGGGVFAGDGLFLTFDGCTFSDNAATTTGGGLDISWIMAGTVRSCTFADNSAPVGGGINVLAVDTALTVENTIIAFSTAGEALACGFAGPGALAITCCDFFDNAAGDWVGCVSTFAPPVGNNIWVDPLFCRTQNPAHPYTLHSDSPCAAANYPLCGLIGAWDVGCGPSPVEMSSWGAIKAMYR